MIIIGFFLLSLGIFIIFMVLITLLGYFFQYSLFKFFRAKKISLTIFLESFGVGTVVFIFYSYFIIDFVKVFNLFTIYFPLIIFDSVSLTYVIQKHKLLSKSNLQQYSQRLKNFFSNKRVKKHGLMLGVIFMLFFIVQGVIETQLSLPSKDTYNWLDLILYLHRYGDLNYDNYTVHGVGFVIFIAGALLITGDIYIQYFFIKYFSLFFFSLIILAIYNVSSWIFKRDIEIFIILVTLLCFNTLLIRFSFAVPSIIATTLGILFFNTLTQEEDKRIIIIRGILLGGMFLTHPLYLLFLFAYLILFELFRLIQKFRDNLEDKEENISKSLLSLLKKYITYIVIIVISSIPYFLNLHLSDKNLYENFTRYLYRGYSANINNSFTLLHVLVSPETFIMKLRPSRTDFFYNLIFFGLNIPINKTLNWGVIIIILGLFSKIKWNNQEKTFVINFVKFSLMLTFIIFIGNSFLFIIDNNFILSLSSFINQYGTRAIELFSPIWSILFVLGISSFLEFIKKYKNRNLKGYAITKEKIIAKLEKKYDKIYVILLVILSASLYSSHLYLQYNVLYVNEYDDDNLTEAVLFISDYFNKENIEDVNILLPDNFDSKVIYRIIYQKDIDRDYLEFDNTNCTELRNAIEKNNADFVLVYKEETKDSCVESIEEKEDILYENPNFIFYEV